MNTDLTFVTIAQDSGEVIEACLNSCEGIGRHLVIDGGSSDETPEISRSRGAEVVCNPFQYAAQQYNFALGRVATKWAFIVDSDERLTPELRQELLNLEPVDDVSGYEVSRLNIFLGTEISHSGWWPDYNVRLLRVADCVYDDREVHARVKVSGRIARLQAPIRHLTYRSVTQYLSKLNRFTSREVLARRREQVATDSRSALRRIWLRTPFRPASRFAYMYIVRRGFLDGRAGLHLAVLSAFYEYIVGLKVRYESPAQGDADH